jgi:hypothetical protein
MRTINMPSFNAEMSLYRAREYTSIGNISGSSKRNAGIIPQLRPEWGCDLSEGYCWLCWEEPAFGRSYCKIY